MNCPRLFCPSLLRDETKAFPFWCANWVIGIVFYVKRKWSATSWLLSRNGILPSFTLSQGKFSHFLLPSVRRVRAYRVTSMCLMCQAVDSARRPCGVPGGAKGLRWDGLYCRRLSLSEGGSQPDNLNQVRTIPFWVRYRKSVGWLSITLPKRLGPEMVQRP